MSEQSGSFGKMWLEGGKCFLEPLTMQHVEQLKLRCAEGDLWKNPHIPIPHPDRVDAYVKQALANAQRGTDIPFAVGILASGEIIGTTRYKYVDRYHRRTNISTWIVPRWHRTSVNSELKLMMLSRAFEHNRFLRLEFLIHPENIQSRKAVERLGCRFEGVLRSHIIVDGTSRDSAVYSIIASEWPELKARLIEKMDRYEEAPACGH
jgi:N-acetyltransferase